MNYLHDNQINLSVTYPDRTALPKGLYTYRVRERNAQDRTDEDCRVVFVGNFYADGSERYHIFNIADIVRNDVEVFATDTTYSGANNVRLVTTYWLEVNTGSAWVASDDVQVAHIYRYPNFNAAGQEYLNPISVFFNITSYSKNYAFPTLQGFNRFEPMTYKKCALIPRYPLYEDEQTMAYSKYPFGLTIETGDSVQSVYLYAVDSEDGDIADSYHSYEFGNLGFTYNTSTLMTPMGDIVGQYDSVVSSTADVEIWMVNDLYAQSHYFRNARVAIFERCFSRYYLFWQDRFGSFQSQPFSEFTDYSEDINVDEVQNYMNTRRRANVVVQPKWKITSGWIKESLYPYYESLYVSPVLKLLDTKYDMVYDVIFSGNYVEKNYHNQKKLINITLDLEQTNTQNILY